MSGRSIYKKEVTLERNIATPVTKDLYARLKRMQKKGGYNFMSELIRDILLNRRIKYLVKDVSMHGPMETLAVIRKDIKAINMQIQELLDDARKNQASGDIHIQEIKTLYRSMEPKIDQLLNTVTQLAIKWLQ